MALRCSRKAVPARDWGFESSTLRQFSKLGFRPKDTADYLFQNLCLT